MLLRVLLALLLTVTPVWAADEAAQAAFLRVLFSRPEGEWPEVIGEHLNVVDASFFERLEARIDWDLKNDQVEDALRFARVGDLTAAALGRSPVYGVRVRDELKWNWGRRP